MEFRFVIMAAAGGLFAATCATAQETPVQPSEPVQETISAPSGADWWIFSRSDQRRYLIDVNSVARTDDALTVAVARVPREGAPGDYSHTEDLFGVRCAANESHVERSTDVFEDGEPTEPYVTDEPWATIPPDSLDEGVKVIACENSRPPGPSFPSVRAYIDAGRP